MVLLPAEPVAAQGGYVGPTRDQAPLSGAPAIGPQQEDFLQTNDDGELVLDDDGNPVLRDAPTIEGLREALEGDRLEDQEGSITLGVFLNRSFVTGFLGFVQWLIYPICVVFEEAMNYLGFPEDSTHLNFQQGGVGYWLGIINAWLPVSEAIGHLMSILAFFIVWIPIKLVIRYFVPGLG